MTNSTTRALEHAPTPPPLPPDSVLSRPVHLASLAAALRSGDREALGRMLDEMADELLVLVSEAPDQQQWAFLAMLYETVYGEARELLDPPEPKRRWFR